MRNSKHWLVAIGLATVLISAITFLQHNTKVNEQRLQKKTQQLEAQTKAQHDAEVQHLKKIIEQKDKELQSKAAEKARIAAEKSVEASKTPVVAKVVQSIVPTAQAATGDAKGLIYSHESGNIPSRVNSQGCYGLGQDCNNVLATACPAWQTDYACQDAFWTAYMVRRYSTWDRAWAFWNCIGQCTSNYGTITKTATWW